MKQHPTLRNKYSEHTESINRYNLWFIRLRWYAVAALISFVIMLKYLFGIGITNIQFYSYTATTFLIAAYNFYFQLKAIHSLSIENQPQQYAFYQIILDLLFLSVLVYFSGGIEAPIFLLYIFHMIIGSMVLPEKHMYIIASILILFLSLFSCLEYYGVVQHQTLLGLYPFQLYKSVNFMIGFLSVFSFTMIMSIRLTSRIVSELYRREDQLRRALQDVKDAETSKQKYLMAVVHELKSPIVAATSNLDLVIGKYVGDIGEQAMEKVLKSKVRLGDAIDSINNILRFSQYRLMNKLENENIILTELIEEIIAKHKQVIEKKKITILFDFNDPLEIMGDRLLLGIAFSNLVGNAVKYTPEVGNIRIEMKAEEKNAAIKFFDDGIGIPKDELKIIFEEYYRASNVKSIEGTGTGLSTVKQIIESHGGNISVTSPSKIGIIKRPGTEFQITLPIK